MKALQTMPAAAGPSLSKLSEHLALSSSGMIAVLMNVERATLNVVDARSSDSERHRSKFADLAKTI
jgi:hypothetical protein